MKYKVGDKFLQEIEIIAIDERMNSPYVCEPVIKTGFDEKTLEEMRKPDDITSEEAWEIVKKILLYLQHGGFNATELEEIFGRTEHLWELSPQEAKAKIEEWEAEKEIKVGDVVRNVKNPEIEVMITKHYYHDGDYYDGINSSGAVYSSMRRKNWKKTGRYINIQDLLEKIGEEEKEPRTVF